MIFPVILYSFALLVVFYALAKICDQHFIRSLDLLARRMKLNDDVTGATFMAIGTSAPELFTAIFALLHVNAQGIGPSTIIGSAIFNVLVIVGLVGVMATGYLHWRPVLRDMGFYALTVLLMLATFADGRVTTLEASTYLLLYACYIAFLFRWNHWYPHASVEHELGHVSRGFLMRCQFLGRRHTLWSAALWPVDRAVSVAFPNLTRFPRLYPLTFAISMLWIAVLSYLIVMLGIGLAKALGIAEEFIGLTVLAAGTSAADLIASLIVARHGRGDMAISNAIGSNTFDILVCLGLPWLGYTILTGRAVIVATENLASSALLLFFTMVALGFVLAVREFKFGRQSGYFLVFLYAMYLCYTLYSSVHPEILSVDALLGLSIKR